MYRCSRQLVLARPPSLFKNAVFAQTLFYKYIYGTAMTRKYIQAAGNLLAAHTNNYIIIICFVLTSQKGLATPLIHQLYVYIINNCDVHR